jgi:hypothetical protein
MAGKIRALIGGLSLERAALLADTIKDWDKNGVDNPKSFHVALPKIDRQLRDFWRANQPAYGMHSAAPSHHWFHYTDVPVMPAQNYGDGTAGRGRWDIVHMIPYCVEVLRGRRPEQTNARSRSPLRSFSSPIMSPIFTSPCMWDRSISMRKVESLIRARTNQHWPTKAEIRLRWS